MAIVVMETFVEHLGRNRGPVPCEPGSRCTPNYGVVATLEGDVLEVDLMFRAGSAYRCYEWGCHISFTLLARRWDDLLSRLVSPHFSPVTSKTVASGNSTRSCDDNNFRPTVADSIGVTARAITNYGKFQNSSEKCGLDVHFISPWAAFPQPS